MRKLFVLTLILLTNNLFAQLGQWDEGVEGAIDAAYRKFFKTYRVAEQIMTLRMPFAQENERSTLAGAAWQTVERGKGNAEAIWMIADEALSGNDFINYQIALNDGREKVIVFDIPASSWTVSYDIFDIARLKSGRYTQIPHKPHVLVPGTGISDIDVYNYLYCVAHVGVDCSGFVWRMLSAAADFKGIDLARRLRYTLGAATKDTAAIYAGTSFYSSTSRELISLEDKISNLRPADIILFIGPDGKAIHSMIIQSINRNAGIIRYLQSTDEAPTQDRGVHESLIYFNPDKPDVSLKDRSVQWQQKRFPPFPGEMQSDYVDDGARYRAYPEHGGGRVVRIKALQ
ncbi:MAG: peptidoglycan endopeptidase [Spirochaetaceae bacterium]|nr:peptidoglycan endopeptidase [Spirochaetaceae bacterium]